MEGVLFNSPIILGGFFLALIILIFELRTSSTGYFLPALSVFINIIVTVYAILLGATLQEIVITLLVFVIINLTTIKNNAQSERQDDNQSQNIKTIAKDMSDESKNTDTEEKIK